MEAGVSMRAHLRVVERNTRRQVERLHKRCPEGALHVWEWFIELCGGRQSGFGGAEPITYAEILAWSTLTAARPTATEISMLKSLDQLFLSVYHQESKK